MLRTPLLGALLPLLATPTCALDAALRHSLLGRHCVLLSSALPFESDRCLEIADAALTSGASVQLLVPLPASGEAARCETTLRLLQLTQRKGFPQLMEALGFAYGSVSGQYGTGNRPRVSFAHVRCDDVETLNLALADCDLLLLHGPALQLPDAALDGVRTRMQRRALRHVLGRLSDRGVPLHRDASKRLRWAWLRVESSGA
eukprot:61287-Prymnesium_polylepis.3